MSPSSFQRKDQRIDEVRACHTGKASSEHSYFYSLSIRPRAIPSHHQLLSRFSTALTRTQSTIMTPTPFDRYAESMLEREFLGYGMDTPDPKWPGGANVAVSFIEGQCDYGAREGVPRLLRLFEEYDMKCTWNVSTLALEQASYWAKAHIESGSESSCAGKRYLEYATNIAPEVEEQHIHEAITSLQTITGDKTLPHGWFVDRPSNLSTLLYTCAHSSLSLPTLYSSNSSSDELPFWAPSPLVVEAKEDKGFLMVPMSHDTGDWKFSGRGAGWASPKDFYEYFGE
ncbi:hypothetical protein P7C70_g8937, partial [Phenoliferia sp. Uapishka_3]